MFIGHYAVALAARSAAPKASLGSLVAAAQLIDLLWPFFLLLGLERVAIDPGNTALTPLDFEHYPYTHSLVGTLGWALAMGLLYYAWRRNRGVALLVGAVVASHWLLDLVVHRPDLPLTLSGEARLGLGLWNHPAASIGLELLLFAGGLWLYARSTRPRSRAGSLGLWSMAGLLLFFWLANLFGPPPPSAQLVAWSALLLWLFVPWAAWIDRNRVVVEAGARGDAR